MLKYNIHHYTVLVKCDNHTYVLMITEPQLSTGATFSTIVPRPL